METRIESFLITVGLCLTTGLLASKFISATAFLPTTATAFFLAAAIKLLQRKDSHTD